jgi:hypothetical protein
MVKTLFCYNRTQTPRISIFEVLFKNRTLSSLPPEHHSHPRARWGRGGGLIIERQRFGAAAATDVS